MLYSDISLLAARGIFYAKLSFFDSLLYLLNEN